MRCLVLLVVSVASVGTAYADDRDLMQGRWALVSQVLDGKKMGADRIKGFVMQIEGDVQRIGREGKALVGGATQKLDAARSPKQMDLTPLDGPARAKVLRAIYRLEGDTLTICSGLEPGDERPTDFTSEPGSRRILAVWRRVR